MKLPPLNALRAFEVAARQGGFTAAATELGVSSAAVSQQVRKLEQYLGRNLFFRNNNQIQLTDAGRDLYVNAAAALDQISGFTAGFLSPSGPRPLCVSAVPSLADRWLPGRLAMLTGQAVRLLVADDPVDMEGQGIDIRVTYGAGLYPGFRELPLFRDALTPMAVPDRAADWDARPPDLGAHTLIGMDWGPSFLRTPTWANWCQARGIAPPGRVGVTVPGGSAALALAEAGAGFALGQIELARAALDAGRLTRLSRVTIPLPQPYVAVVAHARLRLNRVRRMLAVLGLPD